MVKKFSIPGYFLKFEEITILLAYYKNHSKYFYTDRIIDSTYDFPPGLIWNGGRILPFHNFDQEKLYQAAGYYKDADIKLRHTCTNLLLDEHMMYDWQSNLWVRITEKEGNSVITATDVMAQHIKKTYPLYNIIWSTTLDITDINKINDLTQNDMVVLQYSRNTDDAYLKQIQRPDRCEILCAEPCLPYCPYRKEHYIENSKKQLWYQLDEGEYCLHNPPHLRYNLYDQLKFKTAVTNERIDQLANMGFQYFKISGRISVITTWLEPIIYYLVLPEYRDYVRQELFNRIYKVVDPY